MQGCSTADRNDPAVVEAIMEDLGLTKLDLKTKSNVFFGRNIERDGPHEGGFEIPEWERLTNRVTDNVRANAVSSGVEVPKIRESMERTILKQTSNAE